MNEGFRFYTKKIISIIILFFGVLFIFSGLGNTFGPTEWDRSFGIISIVIGFSINFIYWKYVNNFYLFLWYFTLITALSLIILPLLFFSNLPIEEILLPVGIGLILLFLIWKFSPIWKKN